MILIFLKLIIFYVITEIYSKEIIESKSYEWDILEFTQHWPVTTCIDWKNKNEKNSCKFPSVKGIWTVHGIWPTKIGTEGPIFCNLSQKFDPTQLYNIEKNLELFWLNIEDNTPKYSFWKHEWLKHGTCALSLESLNSQLNYFSQALKWIQNYNMHDILLKNGIQPSQTTGFLPNDINDSIMSVLEKRPMIQCVSYKSITYLSQVTLCFDKNLTLIDCEPRHTDADINEVEKDKKIITNCKLDDRIMYLNNIIPKKTNNTLPRPVRPKNIWKSWSNDREYFWIEMYRVVSLLQWLTS